MKSISRHNKILIVTGISGAGRTTSLKVLEDLGFEAVDNLPVFLLEQIINLKIKNNIAIGIDIRSREFNAKKIAKLINIEKERLNISVLFLDCDTEILINRYKESRRDHPLKLDLPITHIIDRERTWLEPLKKESEYNIDTSNLSVLLLKKQITGFFGKKIHELTNIRIISFGYKYGLPKEADYVFDMRFIKNPFYVKNLKNLTGKNKKVISYIKQQQSFNLFFKKIEGFFENVISGFREENKNYITIAFGCTGGIHRSVVSSDYLYGKLKKNKNLKVFLDHRDVNR